MNEDYDLIVVGGGALGTFHAYYASRRGLKVLLLEKDVQPTNATVRNFGMIATSSIAQPGAWQQYANDTNDLYRELDDQIVADTTLRKEGSYFMVNTDLEVQVLKEYCEIFPEAEFLNEKALKSEIGLAKDSYVSAGAFCSRDMCVDPKQFIHIVQNHFVNEKFYSIKYNSNVLSIQKNGISYEIKTQTHDIFHAQKVIICSGTDYQQLFYNHFMQSGMQICKLQMLRTGPFEKISRNILSGLSLGRYPAFNIAPSKKKLKEAQKGTVYEKYGIHLLFKQTDDGSLIIGDSHEYFGLDQHVDYEISSTVNDYILGYANEMLDLKELKIKSLWIGFYMVNPREEVYNVEIEENIHVVTGIGGKGMSTGAGFSKFNIEKII